MKITTKNKLNEILEKYKWFVKEQKTFIDQSNKKFTYIKEQSNFQQIPILTKFKTEKKIINSIFKFRDIPWAFLKFNSKPFYYQEEKEKDFITFWVFGDVVGLKKINDYTSYLWNTGVFLERAIKIKIKKELLELRKDETKNAHDYATASFYSSMIWNKTNEEKKYIKIIEAFLKKATSMLDESEDELKASFLKELEFIERHWLKNWKEVLELNKKEHKLMGPNSFNLIEEGITLLKLGDFQKGFKAIIEGLKFDKSLYINMFKEFSLNEIVKIEDYVKRKVNQKNKLIFSILLHNIAIVYFNLKENNKALSLFEESNKVFKNSFANEMIQIIKKQIL